MLPWPSQMVGMFLNRVYFSRPGVRAGAQHYFQIDKSILFSPGPSESVDTTPSSVLYPAFNTYSFFKKKLIICTKIEAVEKAWSEKSSPSPVWRHQTSERWCRPAVPVKPLNVRHVDRSIACDVKSQFRERERCAVVAAGVRCSCASQLCVRWFVVWF